MFGLGVRFGVMIGYGELLPSTHTPRRSTCTGVRRLPEAHYSLHAYQLILYDTAVAAKVSKAPGHDSPIS